ncbi:hypothetical protein C8Q77DRAFT_515767 [Trametes polyzona]|nr:hypothetical protein C8Q77DRAFT_515767 [Trametes polyzona]
MRKSGRSSAATSPTKLGGYAYAASQLPMAIDPTTMQALMYAQYPYARSNADGVPVNYGYPQGAAMHYPPGVTAQQLQYAAYQQMVAAQQLQLQHAFALQQAQLAQRGYMPQQQFMQFMNSQMDASEAADDVEPEVGKPLDPEVVKGIKKRALFVAPALRGVRIPQACERCRRRKTKCTGEKPRCKRCQRRNHECVYVWDHRANKTKKAVAEREQAAREAEEAFYAQYGYDVPMLMDPYAVAVCPPAGPAPSCSSSSGYSAVSPMALPPSMMLAATYGARQTLPPSAEYAYASSTGYSTSTAGSALPTPAIMIDGRPLAPSPVISQDLLHGAAPISRSRSDSRIDHRLLASSTSDLDAMSRSTSAMSMQYSSMSSMPSSTSCQACLSEMADCRECAMERAVMHTPQKQNTRTEGPEPGMSPDILDRLMQGPLPPSPPLEAKQHLLNVLNKVLADKAAGRAQGSPQDTPATTPPVPPLVARGDSSSSSGSDDQAQCAVQTPPDLDYFAHPGSAGMLPGSGTISPAALTIDLCGVDASGNMGGVDAASKTMQSGEVIDVDEYQTGDAMNEGGLQFNDYFQGWDQSPTTAYPAAATTESMQTDE